ncbi:DUF2564 family protein [Bacillus marinisedimentorum]|uniref:DUF2564 family protein n=1 Tax=Bacillus marinisedimentorum TaxID=1821260 RepID=UPI000A87AD0E|nr:DUF2564 family protein [Bacillus marinisedimentorum]
MSEPYNELKQLEMSIKAAQKMVGTATMSMDPDQLSDAERAVTSARLEYSEAVKASPGTDEQFFEQSMELLDRCEEQLKEAQR